MMGVLCTVCSTLVIFKKACMLISGLTIVYLFNLLVLMPNRIGIFAIIWCMVEEVMLITGRGENGHSIFSKGDPAKLKDKPTFFKNPSISKYVQRGFRSNIRFIINSSFSEPSCGI
jgi:hypothetical protein